MKKKNKNLNKLIDEIKKSIVGDKLYLGNYVVALQVLHEALIHIDTDMSQKCYDLGHEIMGNKKGIDYE